MSKKPNPLLLLDNSTMHVVGVGEYRCTNLSFEEAKAIIDMYDTEDIVRCFTDRAMEEVLCNYVGIQRRDFFYKQVRRMNPGQDAIVIKTYITKSETEPEITSDDGVVVKKIQNIYVYCQCITRMS